MNKKANTFIILSLIFILIVGVSYSYSKYVSKTNGNINAEIAKWNISVNGCNIVSPDESKTDCFSAEKDESGEIVTLNKNFDINEINYNNENGNTMAEDKIGPGSSGFFKIKIQPNDTEVSIKYKLNISKPENEMIEISVDGPVNLVDGVYEGSIKYSANNRDYVEEIIVNVDWKNDDNNNESDSEIGVLEDEEEAKKLSIPVTITFEQDKGNS